MKKGVKRSLLLAVLSCLWAGVILSLLGLSSNFGALVLAQSGGLRALGWFLLAAGLFSGFFVVAAILSAEPAYLVIAAWPSLLTMPALGSWSALVMVLSGAAFWVWGRQVLTTRSELTDFRKPRYYISSLASVYSLLCLVFGVLVYGQALGYVNQEGLTIPQTWRDRLLTPLSQQISSQLEQELIGQLQKQDLPVPGVDFGQFLKGEVMETLFEEGQTRQSLVPQSLKSLPEMDVAGEVETKLQEWLAPYTAFLLPLLGILAFLSLRFFGGIAALVGQVVFVVLLWFLQKIGFLTVKSEPRPVQIPEL